MKKWVRNLIIAVVLILVLCAAMFAVWAFVIQPRLDRGTHAEVDTMKELTSFAKEVKNVDFEEDEGLLYVNNEIIVYAASGATPEQITALAEQYDGEADVSMADIGAYRLIFEDPMSYDKLSSLLKKIKSDGLVESAYLNLVSPVDGDSADEAFEYRDPVFPSDDWDGDTWNMDAPRGANWGMEAISAPGAWAYRDLMSRTRIGLIDGLPTGSHSDLTIAGSSCLFIDDKTGEITVNNFSVGASDHGTHVSGIMSAEWDNGQGVSGVMGGLGDVYYSAVYYQNGSSVYERYATAYSYLQALKTLIDQDVQVINISQNTSRLIGFAASHGNRNAINYLTQQAKLAEDGLARIVASRQAEGKPDFVICVAAGNSNYTYYYPDETQVYGYRETMTAEERSKYITGWRGEIGGSLAKYNNFLNLMTRDEAKDRVIVVGAVGIDGSASSTSQTKYSYAYFSNVGDRVDVVAPGVDIYSSVVSGYSYMSGTSMACPHAAGVAGLIFACNPDLSGPEVKNILIASSVGRYYYDGGVSGMVNADISVVNALQTQEKSVNRVLNQSGSGLDLCFVVDTTGSMGDDIGNAKENMVEILTHLAEKTENYRVALIDYRDFAERTHDSKDYPAMLQLDFCSDDRQITDAVNALSLGYGGDTEETVYSGLMTAAGLAWRHDAAKAIIVLGDAPPLDPEPITGYTYDQVLAALYNADINVDMGSSDKRVLGSAEDSLISVFSIDTGSDSSTADFFGKISSGTGGSYAGIGDASLVGDTIIDSIEKIEVVTTVKVSMDFGSDMANEPIDLYRDGEYLFTFTTDASGRATLDGMEPDEYRWTSRELFSSGSVEIEQGKRKPEIVTTHTSWAAPIQKYWKQQQGQLMLISAGVIGACILMPVLFTVVRGILDRKKRPARTKSE